MVAFRPEKKHLLPTTAT